MQMMPKNDRSLQAKETALLALAQGDPEFPAFLDRYRQALPQVAELPADPWSVRDCCRFNAVLNELIAGLLEGGEESSRNPMLKNARYRELLDYVNEYLSAELTVEELASFMNMGREIFSRKFRADFGLAPKEFLTRMLLRRASDLLLAPNIRVKEVAARLKFRNEFYFSRFFRKHTNIPPGEYRRFYRE